ncbi:MAG: glycoside hydrolase [Tannerellaceae bacterium]|jgi:predicted neuraminidase|nr:glycoside hydrolase [Tannerellaceae bacterium]
MRTFVHLSVLATVCLVANGALYAQQKASFLSPPQVVQHLETQYRYAEGNRKFTGIPSFAITAGGRMWATWYAGMTPDEDDNNYVVLATSGDGGDTWEEVLVVDPDGKGPVRAFDPELWISPDNTLWLFWAQAVKHDGSVSGVWTIRTKEVERKNPVWSSPERLTDGIMMCKPTVLSNGDWVLPVSTWMTAESAKAVVSTDRGKTWNVRGACDIPEHERTFDEPMIVEKKDESLWMWIRTESGIGESFSKDRGKTWSKFRPMDIKHESARFFVRRLMSGNLLLVKNGPIEYETGRRHLMAFLSKDDGTTWSRGLLLDERAVVSYPDGQQAEDGRIYITYDYNRTTDQRIFLTSFTEEDILAEDYDVRLAKVYTNRRCISRGGTHSFVGW